MRKAKIVSVLIVFLILFCSFDCFAQEKTNSIKQNWRNFLNSRRNKEQQKENTEKPQMKVEVKNEKKLTQKDMLERIYKRIDTYNGDLISRVPSLKVKKDEKGNSEYFGVVSSVLVKLEKMEIKDLRNLYNKVAQASAVLSAERIKRQLDNVKRINKLTSNQSIPEAYKPPRTSKELYVPKLPKVPKVPTIPKAPIIPNRR